MMQLIPTKQEETGIKVHNSPIDLAGALPDGRWQMAYGTFHLR